MVNVQIDGDRVTVKILGLHKLWAFRSSLTFRLRNVVDVRFDPGITVGLYRGLRMPGTHIPGVVVAGTYYREKRKEFWDVGKIENSIVVDLEQEKYDRLVIETVDPLETISLLTEALERHGQSRV
jgi:hypothetical protein